MVEATNWHPTCLPQVLSTFLGHSLMYYNSILLDLKRPSLHCDFTKLCLLCMTNQGQEHRHTSRCSQVRHTTVPCGKREGSKPKEAPVPTLPCTLILLQSQAILGIKHHSKHDVKQLSPNCEPPVFTRKPSTAPHFLTLLS